MEMKIANASEFSKLGDFLEKISMNNAKGVLTFIKGQGKIAFYLQDSPLGASVADIRVENIKVLQDMLETSQKIGIENDKTVVGVLLYVLSESGYSAMYKELSSLPPISSPWNVSFQSVLMNLVKEYDENQEMIQKIKEKKILIRPNKTPERRIDLTISEKQWPVLVGMCGGSLKDSVFATADVGQNITTLNFLAKSGLISFVEEGEVENDEGKPLPPEFENQLREILLDATGPFGELMIDEAKEAAGIDVITTTNWFMFIEELKSRIDSDCVYKGRSCRKIVEELVKKYL